MSKKRTATVGERIIHARTTYRMSQAKLGDLLSVTRAAISQYEQDKIRPRAAVVDRLAALFKCDPEWFDRGHGKGPDSLAVPVTVPEIDLGRLTRRVTDLRNLSWGRDWQVPTAALSAIRFDPDAMITCVAPNDAPPIQRGDRVLINQQLCQGPGLFLVVENDHDPRICKLAGLGPEVWIIGGAVGHFHFYSLP